MVHISSACSICFQASTRRLLFFSCRLSRLFKQTRSTAKLERKLLPNLTLPEVLGFILRFYLSGVSVLTSKFDSFEMNCAGDFIDFCVDHRTGSREKLRSIVP